VAYADLGTVYCNLGESGLCAKYATKAYAFRQRVTEKERFYIDSNYYMYATGELDKAAEVFREWKQVYPQSLIPYVNFGLVASNLGWLDAALSNDLEALRLRNDVLVVYQSLSFDYLSLNRLDEAGAILDQARAHKMDEPMLPNSYQLAFLRNDTKEMERCLTIATGKPAIESAVLSSQADTEAFQGHLKKARAFSRRAIAASLRTEAKEDAADWQVTGALREAEFGNTGEARQDAKAALSLAASRNVQIAAALAYARAADFARAQAMVADLQKRFPTDTLLTNYWVPSIRAAIAISRKNAAQAISHLQVTSPYELSGGAPPFSSGGTMYPVYLRGQAYLETKQWKEAGDQFRNILAHRGLVQNFPLGVLAKLQLARAYAGSGDLADARVAYQAFLTLWHDSDPDIPIVRRARAEYAHLE
jgi:eukaryotic-like serine/threonine-protein kinase